MILRVLSDDGRHGYGIARRIEQLTDGALTVQEGSLYPALHRLEKKAYIRSEWDVGETKRRMKVYSLTEAGADQLNDEIESWELVSNAVNVLIKRAQA